MTLSPFDCRSRRMPLRLLVPIVALAGLYWFSLSFFLAKRSLPFVAKCDEARTILQEVLLLTKEESDMIIGNNEDDNRSGCWLPRKVDSVVILVVDALRFDFARDHLPMSVGSRISQHNNNRTTASQLLQFVADPPTVTMQRLKGLTTGSLPTFADISGNLGGASIEEDSWVEQLKTTPHSKRGLKFPSRIGFVGDDTWVDLYPRQFDESYPFPSFNTRDLDTVDDGCLEKLPLLLKDLRMNGTSPKELEVIVSHFLGVDHVGHTYGPHDKHMGEKLQQMDVALSATLDVLDTSQKCHLAVIFGDHGMTEDGNHGGGTDNEINAALFVHFSPACGDMSLDLTPTMGTKYIQDAFQSIHQIDLVPTISILLGLPIPYANIGGIVPSLVGSKAVNETAAALALNAAQVWRYFTVYSETANKLPNLLELQLHLEEAIRVYKQALFEQKNDAYDSNAFYNACGLFKTFLAEASELGHAVWTRFDIFGMTMGGLVFFVALLLSAIPLLFATGNTRSSLNQYIENILSAVFVIFQSGLLSFSNSYIEAEQQIVMFMLQILGLVIFVRIQGVTSGGNAKVIPYIPLLVPLLSRIAEITILGHGMDPSLRTHIAHNPMVYLSALVGITGFRIYFYSSFPIKNKALLSHTIIDCMALFCLSLSWFEKGNIDQTRNGYAAMRTVIGILILCTPVAIAQALLLKKRKNQDFPTMESQFHSAGGDDVLVRTLMIVFKLIIFKLIIFIMVVTGPSTASTVFFFSFQAWMMYLLADASGFYKVSTFVQATLWRLLIRHIFFATNHGCSFSRLQLSAAFVATVNFNFALSGLQLFLNTFGW
eukprot:CAMPEP_0197199060 /NCGR_PEP_ID=MMETSP1423-20130617/33692_1 /TAXON_ID=476441 /ORGANISM="Pseudo-nitzschia heimii, Strain UNC1101" /LENGTH=825 /DNA_ID=CAMNT_0042652911 /DNA_START=11 /DNA_END=2485 /DNA_ORIENTATION=-